MNWNDDTETESRLRQDYLRSEDLYYGNVSGAKEWLRQIEDSRLRAELAKLIREYEGN